MNAYGFAPNVQTWVDPLGLWSWGDPLSQPIVNASAAFGDTITGGITAGIRQGAGIDGGVSTESTSYKIGSAIGEVFNMISPSGRAKSAGQGLFRIFGKARRTPAKRPPIPQASKPRGCGKCAQQQRV